MEKRSNTRPSYALAQERIARGEWRIDPSLGLVYGVRGRPLNARCGGGYIYGRPSKHAGYSNVLIHRVVWEFVNGPIPDGLEINHVNGVKDDNRIANLEMVTHAENVMHAYETGLMELPTGTRTYTRTTSCQAHGVEYWKERFKRGGHYDGYCRECNRIREADRRRRLAACQTSSVG